MNRSQGVCENLVSVGYQDWGNHGRPITTSYGQSVQENYFTWAITTALEVIGCKYRMVYFPNSRGLMAALETGNIDITAPDLIPTADRLKVANYVPVHVGRANLALLFSSKAMGMRSEFQYWRALDVPLWFITISSIYIVTLFHTNLPWRKAAQFVLGMVIEMAALLFSNTVLKYLVTRPVLPQFSEQHGLRNILLRGYRPIVYGSGGFSQVIQDDAKLRGYDDVLPEPIHALGDEISRLIVADAQYFYFGSFAAAEIFRNFDKKRLVISPASVKPLPGFTTSLVSTNATHLIYSIQLAYILLNDVGMLEMKQRHFFPSAEAFTLFGQKCRPVALHQIHSLLLCLTAGYVAIAVIVHFLRLKFLW